MRGHVVACAFLVAGPAQADNLLLDTGERLSGRVISEQGSSVVFESEALGPLTIRRERIARIEKSVAREDAVPAAAPHAEPVAANEPVEADRTASELPSDQPPAPAIAVDAPREDLLRLWIDQGLRYRARPESFIAPFLFDTGDLRSRRALFVGGEAVWLDGPLTLQAEAIYNRVAAPSGDLSFGGAYLSGSYMLTGEEVAYHRAVGVPDRVIPARDFSMSAGTWGAWQVAARASWLDLSDGSVHGGSMRIGALGLNWWWNRYLRWQMDYSYGVTSDVVGAGRLQTIQGRVQFMY